MGGGTARRDPAHHGFWHRARADLQSRGRRQGNGHRRPHRRGPFGLNIVVGWNEGEFDMFGVAQREHEDRYEYAQEWIDVIKMIWSDREDFDFDGKYLHMKGIRGKPKPFGGTPAGDHECRSFADRAGLRDEELRRVFPSRLAHVARGDRSSGCARKNAARDQGRESAAIRSASSPAGRRRRRPRSIFHHCIVEHADWSAVDGILGLKNISPQTVPMEEYLDQSAISNMRKAWADCRSSAIPIRWRATRRAEPRLD